MNENELLELLKQVESGALTSAAALNKLHDMPFRMIGDVVLDTHRELRHGIPEVVFGEGKSPDRILDAARGIVESGSPLLVTRVPEAAASLLANAFPSGEFNPTARAFRLLSRTETPTGRTVAVISAGASDAPVAEEALFTLETFACPSVAISDAGVAGLHRLLGRRELFSKASLKIVVAGMEGALPSVVAGLFGGPVIAVPTSVGYGVSSSGIPALLAMLSSCAPGITVVNIDNGFGAAVAALQAARL